MRLCTLSSFLATSLWVSPSLAHPLIQSPAGSWRTLSTAHYQIHFPEDFGAFARQVASNIEPIHDLLKCWVGHAPQGPVHVLIQNPTAQANGNTIPWMRRPSVVLWTQTPDSSSGLAHWRDWVELLLVHELVHLHHLTIPPENPNILDSMFQWLGASPILRKAPQWVIEGYATFLEGAINGSGRPHGSHRAAVLRGMARQGQLPAYSQLNAFHSPTKSSNPYLLGSAFLEWLIRPSTFPAATTPGSDKDLLQRLWKNLAHGQYDTFDKAFAATFGESPQESYGRFCAHLTHTAVELEKRLSSTGLVEGEVWCRLDNGQISDLSVSPDNRFLLGLTSTASEKGIAVWGFAPPPSRKAGKQQLLSDSAKPLHPKKEPQFKLASHQFAKPLSPHWETAGTIAFQFLKTDTEGVAQIEKAFWKDKHWENDEPLTLRRLTPQRPFNARQWTVDLKKPVSLPFEPIGPMAWDTHRNQLFASIAVDGIPNLFQFDVDPASTTPLSNQKQLTRVIGGATNPAPTPDGKRLFFTNFTAMGSEIRTLDLEKPAPQLPMPEMESSPLVPGAVIPQPDQPSLLEPTKTIPPEMTYSAMNSHGFYFPVGFITGPSTRTLLFGIGGSDVIGRLHWTTIGALGLAHLGPKGAAGGCEWKGTLWFPAMRLFSRTMTTITGSQEMRGLELSVTREWLNWPFSGQIRWHASSEPGSSHRHFGGFRIRQSAGWDRNHWSALGRAHFLTQQGRTQGCAWTLLRAGLELHLGAKDFGLSLGIESGKIQGSPKEMDFFHLGGQSDGLLPDSLEANQLFQCGLPPHLDHGKSFRRWKLDSKGLYYEKITLLRDAGLASFRVAGYTCTIKSSSYPPYIRERIQFYLGRPDISFGLHCPLDGAYKEKCYFTLAAIYRS